MSDKVRVYEIAEEAGASSADVIAKAKDLNIDLKSPQSAVSYEDAEEITKYIMTGKSSRLPSKTSAPKAKKVVEKKTQEIVEEVKETKIELEKVEVIEKKEPEVAKKPELKKVIISKPISKPALKPAQEEFDKPEVNPDNASKIVPKRRGLVIVKKNKPREDEEITVTKSFDSEPQPKKQMKSLSEILGANEEDDKSQGDNYNLSEEQRKNRVKKAKKPVRVRRSSCQ
jgi:translation initiation factor IF-2